MTAHKRLSVHNVTFYGAPLGRLETYWAALGVSRLSILDSQLLDPELPKLLQRNDYTVEAVCHVFAGGKLCTDPQAARDALSAVIDAAAGVGARTVYLLTGGRGGLSWAQAAERFCAMVAPCVAHAEVAGVALAIENASGLYADLHLAHTLRDTIALAEMGGLGICIDVFHCWAEGDFDAMVQRALPRTALIQLSDYVLATGHCRPGRFPATARFRSKRSSPKLSPAATPMDSTWNSSVPESTRRAASKPPGVRAMSSGQCSTDCVPDNGFR